MNILLVYAEFPITYWGFQYGLRILRKQATLPPLGLITVAGLLPAEWTLRLVDMNVEPLTDAQIRWADAVLVGGMLIQAPSMRAAISRAKALGRRTIVGGPAASTSPGEFPEADGVFGGEAEGRVAELRALIEANSPQQIVIPLRKDALPPVSASPVPRFDLLKLEAYSGMAIQYSRGCPFRCEFCDIIEIFGRVPRTKAPAQLLAELDALYAAGWRGPVFLVDDNFIGNVRQVRLLLPEIGRWQRERGVPFELYTEASVNLAQDPALIRAMIEANFTSVFLGIETPSKAALAETQKTQNLRLDLDQAIADLNRAGLEVMAGFIVGFDADDAAAFEAQRAFLDRAPIPLAMVGLLTALPDTALWRRLESEGRLRTSSDGDQMARPNFATAMDEEALLAGYADLLRRVYSREGYQRRCLARLAEAPEPLTMRRRPGWPGIVARAAWTVGVRSPNRRLFWRLLGEGALRSPRHIPWAITRSIQGEHLIRYTEEVVLPRLDAALAQVRREKAASLAAAK